jgi:hypothetical protein
VAHIVAASPDGPRGDEELSPEQQADYDNLMLLCLDHHRLIDGHNADTYTAEQLREYKQKHEERIQRQTAVGPEYATTVVRFESPIGDLRVAVRRADAYQALYPYFPADDKGVFFDYRTKPGRGDEAFWAAFAAEVSDEVRRSFIKGNDEQRYDHLSIFALAPIPILVHLGNQLGNVVAAELYQKHRDTNDWKWKAEPESDPFKYQLNKSEGTDKKNVALVLSLSGKIAPEAYQTIAASMSVYEIEVESANPGFLQHRSRLEKFRVTYRQVMSEIGAKYGGDCTVHLFPAIPTPIAVLCGKELLPKSDPTVRVYDNDKAKGGFVPTLTIN